MYLVHFKVDSHKLQLDECGCESFLSNIFIRSKTQNENFYKFIIKHIYKRCDGCESLQCIKFIFSTEAQLSAATK